MSLGDRMKENYENPSRIYMTRRTPLIVRVDGRAFHTWTKGMERPFDHTIIQSMVQAATELFMDMQGCKAAYVQSDEASFLLTDYDSLQTQPWFGYNKQKIASISASVMTASFNLEFFLSTGKSLGSKQLAIFDSRVFSIPREEVTNYFLWRMQDWERNSLTMYAQAFFSHKQLHGKGRAAKHEMLHSIGKNWTTDLTSTERNGTLILADNGSRSGFQLRSDITPNYQEINEVLEPLIYCDREEGQVEPE